VEAYGALGDGEAYAEASGVGAAGLVDAVEGAEDVGEVGFGDSGALVGDFEGGEVAAVQLVEGRDGFEDADGDFCIGVGVANGVTDDVFDGAVEEVGIAADGALIFFDESDGAGMLLRFVLGVGKELAAELVERDRLEGGGILAGLEGREGEELADELVELGGFALDAREVCG